jgi:outer membrane immunogenic protein
VLYGAGSKDGAYIPLWNGPYFGVHGGAGWGTVDVTDADGFRGFNTFQNNGSGAFGGGTLGWNWQFGSVVTSAEIDLGVTDVSHSTADPLSPAVTAHMDTGVYGDITGRIGYAAGGGLIYAKGGFGFFNGSATVKAAQIDTSFKSQSFTGWTLGAGVEYKITPSWSVKAEYLHFDFGSQEVHFIHGGFRWDNTVSLDTVKAGLNYEVLEIPAPLK